MTANFSLSWYYQLYLSNKLHVQRFLDNMRLYLFVVFAWFEEASLCRFRGCQPHWKPCTVPRSHFGLRGPLGDIWNNPASIDTWPRGRRLSTGIAHQEPWSRWKMAFRHSSPGHCGCNRWPMAAVSTASVRLSVSLLHKWVVFALSILVTMVVWSHYSDPKGCSSPDKKLSNHTKA